MCGERRDGNSSGLSELGGKWTLVWKYLFTCWACFMVLIYGNRRNNFQKYFVIKFIKKDKPNLTQDLKCSLVFQILSLCAFIRDSRVEPWVLFMQDNAWRKNMVMVCFKRSASPGWSQKKHTECHQGQVSGEVKALCVSHIMSYQHRLFHGQPSEAVFQQKKRKSSTK